MPMITRSKSGKLGQNSSCSDVVESGKIDGNNPELQRGNPSILADINRELVSGSSTSSIKRKNIKRKINTVYSSENLKPEILSVKTKIKKSATKVTKVVSKPVEIKSNMSVTQNSSSAYEDCSKVCLALRRKYTNVVERLKLNFVPFCAKNFDFCHAHHSSKCPIPGKAQFDKVREISCFTDHKRHLSFLESMEDMCLRSEFPGEDLLYSLFETILIVNYTEIDEISSRELIRECILLFHDITDVFPPCWHDINQSYRNLLTNPVKIKKLLPNVDKSDENIFTFILSMLEESLSSVEEKETVISSVNIGNVLNIERTIKEWEDQYSPKQNFYTLKREEKIFRLFSVLELITKLLESDLTAWITRHLSKPNKHLYDEKQPIIGSVFGINPYQMVTQNVKRFLRIFINCVQFDYPSKILSVLSRILSLLCTIFNLSDINCDDEDKRITFPSIEKNTETFAREIFNMIDNDIQFDTCSQDGPKRSVKGYLSIIQMIANPYLKYLLINFLTEVLSPVLIEGPMCSKKIVEILASFSKDEWKNCCIDRSISNCVKATKTPEESANRTSKYPIIAKHQNDKRNGELKTYFIYKDDFFKMLLDALKSYCETFDIENVVQIFIKKGVADEETQKEKETPASKKRKRNCKKLIDENDVLSLDEIERNIEQLEKGLNMRHKINSPSPSASSSTLLNLEEFIMIYVDDKVMLRYRDDIKYLLILRQNIPKMQTAYPNEFESWFEFIERNLFKHS